jgi:hypothetical protein
VLIIKDSAGQIEVRAVMIDPPPAPNRRRIRNYPTPSDEPSVTVNLSQNWARRKSRRPPVGCRAPSYD